MYRRAALLLSLIAGCLLLAASGCQGEASFGAFAETGTTNPPPPGVDSGGGGGWDVSPTTPNPTDPPPWPVCAEQTGEAKLIGGGVDIIMFIDTSGSMVEETAWVQQNMNNFAQYIASKNLDYHVVLVAEEYKDLIIIKQGICVPQPLGGPNCTDGPRFRHIKQDVNSTDGLIKLINLYPQYQSFLRPGATVNFVAITDDNSSQPMSWFDAELAKLQNPGFPNGYIFHSIAAFGSDPKRGCPTGARYGKVYEDLSKATGGSMFPVCSTDWKPIFDKLAQSVVQNAKPPCSYNLPTPPDGKTIQPTQIRVTYEINGQSIPIPRVDNEAACGNSRSFYYDNNQNPKLVNFCPATCSAMQGGKIKIVFGCLQIG
ncbi:MAG: hypothetical protein KC503_16010 [Myxococcales bacterium]|nr:hypothetical protein [Myxococcales bacterium]